MSQEAGKLLHLGQVREAILGESDPSQPLTISIQVKVGDKRHSEVAYLDSGSAGNFVQQETATRYGIPIHPLQHPRILTSVDGRPLQDTVTGVTGEVEIQVGALHTERLTFYVLPTLSPPVMLGLPWLRNHEPVLDWRTGEVLRWGQACHSRCLLPVSPVRMPPTPAALPGLPSAYWSYADVFDKKEAETLPPHRPYDCPIDLVPGTALPKGRIYPLNPAETQAMAEYVKDSLARGFIQKSTSPAGAGFFFVKKKDGSLRPCIDYRGLNAITVKNKYPLPLIPELFDRLRGARVFTKLDLRGAYNLIRIRAGDEWKTAFNTRDGHYEYKVMPFGLSNAPAVFQEFVNDVFRDLLYVCVVVYLDDILVFSPDLPTHRRDVRQVLRRLRENRLYAKYEKCLFERTSLPFLGYIISDSGLEMDPEKVSAIQKWPRPVGLKAIQRFVGFANYYRQFIPHFSDVVKPLTALTQKGTSAKVWTPGAESAFQTLKSAFSSAPALHRPMADKQFFLEVDASSSGAGAVLTQKSTTGRMVTCGFFSKAFSSCERNYSIGDRELLAIKMALEEWRYLLEGAVHPVVIYTDHKNLAYLQSAQRLNPRQARWSLFFARFDFRLHFRPAEKNIKADALSRSFLNEDQEEEPRSIIDPSRICMIAPLRLSLPPPGKTLVAEADREHVLHWGHSSRLAGHVGIAKTLQLICRHYWWPQMRQDIIDFVSACSSCARNKTPKQLPVGPLLPLPVPSEPWRHIAMDFITDLPVSSGNTVVWVVVDRFSKMAHFIPLPGLPSAPRLAELFILHVLRLHGLPSRIVSDRGVQFVSRFWRSLCKKLEVALDFSSAYHPQSNGQVERVNQVLSGYLRHFVNAHHDDWSALLPWAEFSYNNHVGESSGKTPFFIVYGHHPRIPTPVAITTPNPAAEVVARDFSKIWDETRAALERSSRRMKDHADKRRLDSPLFQPGDKVWLSSKYVRLKVPSYKLGPRYIGPFEVVRRINEVCYQLRLPPTLRIHNSFHRSLLKPLVLNRYSQDPDARPPPVSASDVFEISAILDKRRRGQSTWYLVDWKGFGPEERSWEPEENINAPRLLRRFLAGLAPGGRGGGSTVAAPPSGAPTRGPVSPSSRSLAVTSRVRGSRVPVIHRRLRGSRVHRRSAALSSQPSPQVVPGSSLTSH